MSVFDNVGDLPWVREAPFREVYLPLLINMQTQAERDRWLTDVAVNMFTRVNVVSDTDEKEVLFWVPAMRYTPETANGGNLMQIAQHYENLNNNIGNKHAERYYEETIADAFVQPEPPQEDIDQWELILRRFGYDVTGTVETNEAPDDTITTTAEDW